MEIKDSIFKNGSVWLKADFHLHTKADKEFFYKEEQNEFIHLYIEQLKQKKISLGLIANHNKLDIEEYKNLKKKALKEGIYLLPGVELSVNDGANGIHCLITFEYDAWVRNGDNFIEQFLNSAFEGIANRENENTRCKYSLTDLFAKLEAHRKDGRDSFIIMAHVEQRSGFCKELEGGRIYQIASDEHFKRNVLAFQKLRTFDLINNLSLWFKDSNNIPALVEGSDCKNLTEIGVCGKQRDENGNELEKETWVKIGDFNFEAVKYALIDKNNRLSSTSKKNNNSYIKSIAFEGGLLDKTFIGFSPELNNFIGIRGSGKSSILEILRYSLGISLGEQTSDKKYKDSLIEHVLRSGGKVIVNVVDKLCREYRIEKIYGQKEDVFLGSERLDIPSIDTIFNTPVYFGQKDLSNKDINFEADLVRKLTGNKLDAIKAQIQNKIGEVVDVITNLRKLKNLDEYKKEVIASISDAEYKLKVFKEKGVEGKLKQQSKFDTDISKFNNVLSELASFQNDLKDVYNNYKTFFSDSRLASEDNKDVFEKAEEIFKQLSSEFEKIGSANLVITTKSIELNNLYKKLLEKKETLKEDFAKIKREINIPNVNPDDFLKLNRIIETSKLKLVEIDKSEKKYEQLKRLLNDKISQLNQLWHKEYQILENEVLRINKNDNSLSIDIEYKGRNDMFKDKLQEVLKGSGLRGATYDSIVNQYKDFIEIFRDFHNINDKLNVSESLIAEFKNRISSNLEELLTFRVHDKFTINYNDKPLKDHSLGQRATALILFLLAQKETDVLIIDQPEDDLDNQTIYEDVIKEIKQLKGEMQFIFATHNANIPVLGDSERIVSCKYLESRIDVSAGTIDNAETQREIVTIMEGGKEAFNKRKNIYSIWNINKRY